MASLNRISPVLVEAGMVSTLHKISREFELKNVRMHRTPFLRELGGTYVYLPSQSASYTTGINISVVDAVGVW